MVSCRGVVGCSINIYVERQTLNVWGIRTLARWQDEICVILRDFMNDHLYHNMELNNLRVWAEQPPCWPQVTFYDAHFHVVKEAEMVTFCFVAAIKQYDHKCKMAPDCHLLKLFCNFYTDNIFSLMQKSKGFSGQHAKSITRIYFTVLKLNK